MQTDDAQLVPVFIPALGAIFVMAEDQKGEPLTFDEVIKIRDAASCIMMRAVDARKMEESRGWEIDPENCWYDWQHLRRELGRKPDLDAGPQFHQIHEADPEYQATIQEAQSTLPQFRDMLSSHGSLSSIAMIKTRVTQNDTHAFMWLSNVQLAGPDFVAEFFEIPNASSAIKVGDRLTVTAGSLLDWMVNDGGILHGGFSLRYHRSQLPENERSQFDQYVGITKYA
jgi:uncharacterized protein YegJ (DUF2314 family)